VIFNAREIDNELLNDFLECLQDSLENIEHGLIRLERDPTEPETINSLFRDMHNIKGNCEVCFLDPLEQLTQAIEDIFAEMRAGKIIISDLLREALLLSLDQFRVAGETVVSTKQLDLKLLSQLTVSLSQLSALSANLLDQAATDIIVLIGRELSIESAIDYSSSVLNQASVDEHYQNADLVFFRILAEQVDMCSPYWDGRCKKNQETALTINFFLKKPINHDQLKAACYLHDIGMAFLPEGIVNKRDKLTQLEQKQMHMHPVYGAEWLKRIDGWQQAAEMVNQHHERPDGQGYPQGLKGDEICVGAKILAITDTFFAITDRRYKKSVLRAVTEISNYMHSQFDETIVRAFNEMIREAVIQKKDKVA